MRNDTRDPIDEALEEKAKLAAQRREQDTQLWQQWKQNPTPDTLRPLMKRFEPVLKQKAQMWTAPGVPPATIRASLLNNMMDAFERYDPAKASLRTHLDTRLRKTLRDNIKQQNYARIPEADVARIGDIAGAIDELKEEYDRPPTSQEIADFLNPRLPTRQRLTAKRVDKIQRAQIGDVVGSSFESDPTPRAINREREVVGLLRPALKPDQQAVFDYLYGLNGKPRVTSTSKLAKLLGKSPSQVSRLKSGILVEYNKYK